MKQQKRVVTYQRQRGRTGFSWAPTPKQRRRIQKKKRRAS